jgi:histidine phosphotransferase ChpT
MSARPDPQPTAVPTDLPAPSAALPAAELAALIGSRICHDLVSPLGAIGNGVELMMMDGAAGPELQLVADSVAQANARLRFFRLAFGAASGSDARVGRGEIASILADLSRGGRHRIGWSGPADLARREAKLGCLFVLCLESAMPWGGAIQIARGPEGGWLANGQATRLRLVPDLWARLDPGTAPASQAPQASPQASDVHFDLAAAEAAAQGLRLRLSVTEGEVTITA